MRYHQGRLIREHEKFLRSCRICGALMLIFGGILLAAA